MLCLVEADPALTRSCVSVVASPAGIYQATFIVNFCSSGIVVLALVRQKELCERVFSRRAQVWFIRQLRRSVYQSLHIDQ